MTTVSTSHAYLGDLEDVTHPHRPYFTHGERIILPLIFLREIVLFPGEQLPMRMLSETNIEDIRDQLATKGALLAVLSPDQGIESYGTTVRVERFNVVENCAAITGAARQRFRLRRVISGPDGWGTNGEVEIIADFYPPRLPFRAPAFIHHLSNNSTQSVLMTRKVAPRFQSYWGYREFCLYDAQKLIRRIQDIMITSAHCNWFQDVYTNPSSLTSTTLSREETLRLYLMDSGIEQDPIHFAYWIASNLPLDYQERLALLKIDSIVHLLQQEIIILRQLKESIYCRRCHTFLSETCELFRMTREGAAGTFVNPIGQVHQLLTLRHVHTDHIYVDPSQSTEDTWFQGYAWSGVYCRTCYHFLGWQFNRVDTLLEPVTFFGLRRVAISSHPHDSDHDNSEDQLDNDSEEH